MALAWTFQKQENNILLKKNHHELNDVVYITGYCGNFLDKLVWKILK